jgi:hypothetical protein
MYYLRPRDCIRLVALPVLVGVIAAIVVAALVASSR